MFGMPNVIFESDKNMHICVVLAFIGTKMLRTVRTFGNDMNDQIICGPFIMLMRASDINCEWRATLISQKMNFAAQCAAVGWIFASF
jgi:hypothetical protein